jgi:quercetin dioxygenase-like cupin family protein
VGRVVIKQLKDAGSASQPGLEGVAFEGSMQVRPLVAEGDQSMHLRLYEMQPGARIRVDRPPTGHAFYVWQGSALVDGRPLETAGAVIAEHGGSTQIAAGPSGATIAHFHHNPERSETLAKAGGHVHVIPPEGIFNCPVSASDAAYVIWADASCPTCDLWLHQTHMPRPTNQGGHHYHSEDEILFIVDGGVVLGNRTLPPGTSIAIDANTIYAFGVPDQGTKFINFRCRESFVVRTKRTKPLHEPINERELLRSGGIRVKGTDVEVSGEF